MSAAFSPGAVGDQSPERQLLLAAAQLSPSEKQQDHLRRLASDRIDWSQVSAVAASHGVAPLMFHVLTTFGAIAPDDQRIAPIKARFFANAGNALLLARELVDLVGLFRNVGVTAIPYKGPALAAALYGNLILREFSDLDIIVPRNEVAAARAALLARGYEPAMTLTEHQVRALVASRGAYFMRFDRPTQAGRVVLELHWRIPSPFPIEGVENRLTTTSLLDHDVPQVCDEDLLLLLSAHGMKHAWNQLKWICDLAQLIERRPLFNWDQALDRATRLGGRRVVLLGCAMAARTLQTQLALPLSTALARDPIVPGLANQLSRRLFERPLARFGVLNNIRIRERTLDKVRYGSALIGHLTTPTVAERVAWPAWPGAGVVYTVGQPFRLIARVVRKERLWNRSGSRGSRV